MWLSNFFHEAFTAAAPLGLAAFANVGDCGFGRLIVAISKGSRALVGIIAIIAVVGILVFNQLFPPSPPPRPIPNGEKPPVPAPPAPANTALWFDTRIQADWGGKDSFYGAGKFPVYEADGRELCNDNLLGQVVTCWQSRPADATSMAPGVPTNIKERRNDWCAYKDSNVTIATSPDGHAPPGRVYACAHSIPFE